MVSELKHRTRFLESPHPLFVLYSEVLLLLKAFFLLYSVSVLNLHNLGLDYFYCSRLSLHFLFVVLWCQLLESS